MSDARLLALLAFQGAGGRASQLAAWERRFGLLETWWSQRRKVLVHEPIRPKALSALLSSEADRRGDMAVAWARQSGHRWVVAFEHLGTLTQLPDPPLVLAVTGQLPPPGAPALTVVGSRRATGYGLRQARRLAAEVATAGVVVLSGLARGVDAAAHRGALDVGGVTVAVLGSGPDITYPAEHRDLRRRIEERGAILTEHLPGTPPKAHHFPRRNRILVALGDALLVVEARIKSGTFTSVRWALDLGREVMAIPGPIDSSASEGTLQLLREGATPVGTCEHVLVGLGLTGSEGSPTSDIDVASVTPSEERILALLEGAPLDLDELVRLSGEAPGRVLALVLGLEVRGLVTRENGFSFFATR